MPDESIKASLPPDAPRSPLARAAAARLASLATGARVRLVDAAGAAEEWTHEGIDGANVVLTSRSTLESRLRVSLEVAAHQLQIGGSAAGTGAQLGALVLALVVGVPGMIIGRLLDSKVTGTWLTDQAFLFLVMFGAAGAVVGAMIGALIGVMITRWRPIVPASDIL
jgi:hypothetical protein